MQRGIDQAASFRHVVAMPYPGRGHINPMMNLCKQLVSRDSNILVTFVVTEEWYSFIASDPKPENIRFATLPNVIPSELVRAQCFVSFVEAVFTKLEEPFERLLDRLDSPPPAAIIADSYVVWALGVGNRRNIPVVSLWTMSATVLAVFVNFDLLVQNQHFWADVTERGDEVVDYIPGVLPTRLADLPTIFYGTGLELTPKVLQGLQSIPKAHCLLFTSVYELEPQAFNFFRSRFQIPVYTIGPSIPYNELLNTKVDTFPNYLRWLDRQPKNSVLYISLGSFLSVSRTQMDEIVAGVRDSGVRFLWVARGDTSKLEECVSGSDVEYERTGLVVSWCDQLRVLCHSSTGGFWTHCGFNSTLEGVYAGVPMLTFPIFWDQVPNSKQIVEDWKIGLRVKERYYGREELVSREEIKEMVKTFMDLESNMGMEMRKRAQELSETCKRAIAEGGSSDSSISAFIRGISTGHAS